MSYQEAITRLADTYAGVDAQRAEADEWYERQVAAATRAVDEATAAVENAQEALDEATELVDRVDAEAEEVWRSTERRLGATAARYGGPPPPVAPLGGEEYNPHQMIEAASKLLDVTWRPGRMPQRAFPTLVVLSALGAALAFALREAALWAGRKYGGDLAVGMPVLALVVTLVAPFVGLWPARVVADRRHVALDATTITVVLATGVATTVALFLLA
ncbi:hypothetical protein [Phytohabitans houttuyneae]|uniref:Uncharacterized protein n=1 Tax=Phytohabitans houttuyneae TaxID=1076126 RepID=A0A6V8KGF9_9ACTN|nr:hypothetical protein [Phytohabitans houttuyneae]GFJ84312.1 hypothetical protein Phou_084920 [Phytohabitans houttuyneae]